LIKDGKVCLSLLGTWNGEKAESWNVQTSTLLQVLVSIQSLILVPQPFFNEPGYERQLGTEEGTTHSRQYNDKQRENTIHLGMVDMLKRPLKSFTRVIEAHFYLRQRYLTDLVDRYIDEARNSPGASRGHLERLERLSVELKERLAMLSPPV
ncbi:unnamed protein product, partial [Choristocarpus tenellus]